MTTKREKSKRGHDYKSDLLNRLKNPAYAVAYMNAALEERDEPGVFLLALKDIAEAHGMRNTARQAGLNRGTFYRILSKKGNPTMQTLFNLFKVLGFCLKIDLPGSGKSPYRKAA